MSLVFIFFLSLLSILSAADLTRQLTITEDYLHLPIASRIEKTGPGVAPFVIKDEQGKWLRAAKVKFPKPGESPDFIQSLNVANLRGQKVTLHYQSEDPAVLEAIMTGSEPNHDQPSYDTLHRPRLHFSARRGWMNDINGLYFHNGLYHLFYQHNPYLTGKAPGFDMHWGHSVSKDLVHWTEYPIALYPGAEGSIFSGTAAVIEREIPGITDGLTLPSPVLFYTGTAPFSQRLATTKDGGQTWQPFAQNPIIPKLPNAKNDRDPKVLWHEPSQHYVMILFVEEPRRYLFFKSKTLTDWKQTSVLADWSECPEFFPVTSPTTGEELYLLYGAYRPEEESGRLSSAYQLGRFDGERFTPVTKVRRAHGGGNFYGAITFANEPKGRRIMMGWAAGTKFPGEPFNQCASLPLEMKVEALGEEDTLCFQPVEEVKKLRGKAVFSAQNTTGAQIKAKLQALPRDETYDIEVTFAAGQKAKHATRVRDRWMIYNPAKAAIEWGNTPLFPKGPVKVRYLIDRGLFECFWNKGEAAFSIASLHTVDAPVLHIGENLKIDQITVYPMKSIWN